MIPAEYEIGNFKALGQPQKIKLRPCTLIFGKNSAGKSSIIQSLLLCRHAVEERSFELSSVSRWGQTIDLGGFGQYVHRHDATANLTIGFRFERSRSELTASAFDSQVERILRSTVAHQTEPLWSFCFLNGIPDAGIRFTVGLLADGGRTAEVKKLEIEAGGVDFLEFNWHSPKKLAFTSIQLDNSVAVLAFASLAAQLAEFFARQESSIDGLSHVSQALGREGPNVGGLSDLLLWLGVRPDSAPKDVISLVEEVYHSVQDRLTESAGEASRVRDATFLREQRAAAELLAQSELFAAFVFAVGGRLREVMKEVAIRGDGLDLRQRANERLKSERTEIARDTGMEQSVEAIEDPIGFYASAAEDDDNLTALAHAMRFDIELLIEAVMESNRYWLTSTNYLGPFRWVPARLSQTSQSLSPHSAGQEGFRAFKDVVADASLLNDVSKLLQETLESPYSLQLRTTAPAVDHGRLREELQRAAELYGDAGVQKLKSEISRVFESFTGGKTTRGVHLVDLRNQTEVDFCDVGFGVGQVLPLLIEVAKGSRGIVCIEQPEVHIHPKMQAALADVFIQQLRNSASPEKLFVLETHSEHIILRLLRRVRETSEWLMSSTEEVAGPKHVFPHEIAVHWVEMVGGEAVVTPIDVTAQGDFDRDWPEGFFDERFNEYGD